MVSTPCGACLLAARAAPMVFSSITFLLFFLPAVLALLACTPRRYHNLLLVLVSFLFYYWGEGLYLLLMVWSIVFNHCAGLVIERWRRYWLLTVIVAIDLAPLLYFKYTAFLLGALQHQLGLQLVSDEHLQSIHLPIGISFCTFHSLSYVVDVFRRTAPVQRNLVRTGLYIALFPQLVAGPIIRYQEIQAQLAERRIRLSDLGWGAERFIYGLAKKVVIANPLGLVTDEIFKHHDQGLLMAWAGLIGYTMQIYYDFSAYSDMAIGLGRMLGFTFPENFNYPYVSRSVQEFWRRWHMSLSHWFRDYVYIGLGGNRHGAFATYRNLLIVFVLCGLWHGANWTFLIWGLWHGGFLVLERGVRWPGGALWRPLQHAYLMLVVMTGWVFFRSDDLPSACNYFASLAGRHGMGSLSAIGSGANGLTALALIGSLVFLAPLGPWLLQRYTALSSAQQARQSWQKTAYLDLARATAVLALHVWCIAQLAIGGYNPFIYFRF